MGLQPMNPAIQKIPRAREIFRLRMGPDPDPSPPYIESISFPKLGSTTQMDNFKNQKSKEVIGSEKDHSEFIGTTEAPAVQAVLAKLAKYSGSEKITAVTSGASSKVKKLRKDILKAARDPLRSTVIIHGEAGLEAENVAALIHDNQGKHRSDVLYRIHCDTSRLDDIFGSVERPGLLQELSDRVDTILLTNLGAIASLVDKERIKRLMSSGQYYCAYTDKEQVTHARIIGSVEGMIPDDYKCIPNVTTIALAPLKERSTDLPLIANVILRRLFKRRGMSPPSLSSEALHRIRAYSWPGNIQELSSALERAIFLFEKDRRKHPELANSLSGDQIFCTPSEISSDFLRFNLLERLEWVRSAAKSPVFFDDFIMYSMPPIFAATIALLILGPQTRENNVALTIFWAWWWPLGLLSFPILGRIWCAVCPFMATGELVQRVVTSLGMQLRSWPAEVKAIGPIFAYSLFFGILLWEELWTLPNDGTLSAYLLLLITSGAVASSVAFEKRMWCRHLCPIGAMNGLYSKMALIEIRSPKGVCAGCTLPRCKLGEGREANLAKEQASVAAGCPMEQGPSTAVDNSNCVMCLRCVKACKNGSPEINLRPPGVDFGLPYLLPVPGTDSPSNFASSPWQAGLMALLQGAVYVHYIPEITSALGMDPSIASSHSGDGLGFVVHALLSAALLVTPACAIIVADALGCTLSQYQAEGGTMLRRWQGEELARVSYGYLPLVWTSNLAFWIGLFLKEGGTLLPRTMVTFGYPCDWLPQVSFSNDVVMFVQGGLLLFGLPFSYFLVEKLADEANWTATRKIAHAMAQAFFVASLWNLMIR